MEELTSNPFYSTLFIAFGLGLLFIEVFIPSGGILGILAFCASAFGIYGLFHQGHAVMASGAIVALVVLGFFTLRFGLRRTRLDASLDSAASTSRDENISDLVGKTGTAHTELRPAGIAVIDGTKIDVVSPGHFISKGAAVEVIDNTGNRVVVTDTRKIATAKPDATT